MRKVSYLLLLAAIVTSCDSFFEIKETTHYLTIRNATEQTIDVQWSIEGDENANTVDRIALNRQLTIEFLSQSGNHDELTAEDIYDQFDELIIIAGRTEIQLENLQIDPAAIEDGLLNTQEWFYTFSITTEHLN